MENTPELASWAQEMASIVERKILPQKQRQQARLLDHAETEIVSVKGRDQVVHILSQLVQALKYTHRFPHPSVLSYAQSPQGQQFPVARKSP